MIHRLARLVAEARLRIQTIFLRSLFARRFLIAIPTLVVMLIAATLLTALNSERRQWGHTSMVFIARQDIASDSVITDAMIKRVEVPTNVVPKNAREELPTSKTLRAIGNGEILVDADFVPSAIAGDLARGWVVVGVGAMDSSLPLSSGDHILAMANGEVVCAEGEVVSTSRSEITGMLSVSIGVPESCAALLAESIVSSHVVLALVPDS